jgi:hypothetical protein
MLNKREKTENLGSPATLSKHMEKVREKWTHDLIFVGEAVSSLDRKRLIEQRIPFVIPGNQMFLPMLGADLREHFRKIPMARSALSPSTQVLVLDALYHPKFEADTPTAASIRLGYSLMTMTRAFTELDQAGLGEHTVNGKQRRMKLPGKEREIWESALPYLRSPVKRKGYTASRLKTGKGLRAGLSALAEYSNLASPENDIFAMDLDGFRGLQEAEYPEWTFSQRPELTEIQLWSYSPSRFGREGIADPLSVYLSLRDEGNERIQSALQDLLKGMPW